MAEGTGREALGKLKNVQMKGIDLGETLYNYS